MTTENNEKIRIAREEIEQVRERLKKDAQEREERLAEAREGLKAFLSSVNMTEEKLRALLGNPNNFTSEDWQKIQSQILKLEKEYGISLQKGQKKSAQEAEKDAKQMRGKTRGLRKKWLPMK